MAETINRRVCGEIDGEFVLFLIGIRLNRPWKLNWLPVFSAMPKMLKELSTHPDAGLLHYRLHFGLRSAMVVQYWRSFAQLNAYAQAREHAHFPAWTAFNRTISTNGDVGIWHETYLVSPGTSESIYVNMPRFGQAAAGDIFDASGPRSNAKKRLNCLRKT